MINKIEVKAKFGKEDLILQTGGLAIKASAAVCATYGGTTVLATVAVGAEPREGVNYLPLLVDYEERLYAAGKISGSRFIKREGRPTDQAILNCRMIDRALRPLFPKDYRRDIQVIATVLSYDGIHDPDLVALNAASAALLISGAPFEGPVAACHVAGEVVNPTPAEVKSAPFDLVVAGLENGRVMMLETTAKETEESTIIKGIYYGLDSLKEVFAAQKKLAEKAKSIELPAPAKDKEALTDPQKIKGEINKLLAKEIEGAIEVIEENERQQQLSELEKRVLENLEGNYGRPELQAVFNKLVAEKIRKMIIEQGQRPDGRQAEEIRPLSFETACLPRTHGSALFQRGQTQVLSIVTLGAPSAEQWLDTMEEFGFKRFMHHYNFPPFATGETAPLRSTSRREIGHGALAEKAIANLLPEPDKFPYTIRAVSEVLSSNGSSSMAAVCGASLALFDAGVPLKSAVAGIAIGLMTDPDNEDNYKILTDIQGIEDFDGDMDFKVAGTVTGLTAIQMDTKIKGLTRPMIEESLECAKKARREILKKMAETISQPREELSPYAPRIEVIKIDPDKIGGLIGPGGKNINQIITDCGGRDVITIDIADDGTVSLASSDAQIITKAKTMIQEMFREVQLDEVFEGAVTEIVRERRFNKEIGAIVQILPKIDGMVHISEISNQHIPTVSSVLKVGQIVKVKVVGVDKEKGRISLSIKKVSE